MLPQMRHNLLMVLNVLIILHQAGFGSSFNADDLKFVIDSHEAFCLMAPKCTLSTTSSSGLFVEDLTEPFTDRVPSITDPALRMPSPGQRTRAPPTMPPFTGSVPPSTNSDSEITDPVPPTTDPVPLTTDSIPSMSSSFSRSLVSVSPKIHVPPPFGNDGSCCSSCSCDLPSCIQYGTCCPDLLEYLPTVKESFSKIKITCDYASLKKDRVPFKTPKGSHVWMYRKCSDDIHTEPFIKERCEEPDKFIDLKTKIPVSDKNTALTYQNGFCALCNNILEDNIFYWDASIECSSNTLIPTSVNTIVEEVNAIEDCTIVYKMPENGMQAPTCTAKIRQCNVTGLWERYDPVIEAACHAYTSIYKSEYNNLFCHLCNEPDRRMPSQCQSSSPGPVLVSFTTLLKFSPAPQLAEGPAAEYDVNKCNLSQTFDPMKVGIAIHSYDKTCLKRPLK